MSRFILNPKIFITLLVVLFVSAANSFADPMYYNYQDLSAPSNSYPFAQTYGKEVNWLFLPNSFSQPTSITESVQITDVYFFVSYGGSGTYTDLTIKMAQDDITTLTSGQFYQGSLETVYYNSSAYLSGSTNKWLKITLDSPFEYDPSKSLILDVEQSGLYGSGFNVHQNYISGTINRTWSISGAPFVPTSYGDGCVVNFGFDTGDSPVVPVPGALLLGSLGLSLAGLRLRRSKI